MWIERGAGVGVVKGDAADVVICGLKSLQIPPAGRYGVFFPNAILTRKKKKKKKKIQRVAFPE